MLHRFGLCGLLVVVGLLAAGCNDTKPAGTPAQNGVSADGLLQEFSDFVKQLPSFQVDVHTRLVSEGLGRPVDSTSQQHVVFQRPNKLQLTIETPETEAPSFITSDGQQVIIYLQHYQRYAQADAPAQLDGVIKNAVVLSMLASPNSNTALTALLSEDPYATLTEDVEILEYVGTEVIDGVETHHLKAEAEGFEWELWLDAGERPLPRQFVLDMARTFQGMLQGDMEISVKLESRNEFSHWTMNPAVDDTTFALHAPAEAEQVDSLMEIFAGPRTQETEKHPLLGQPAPAIDLPTLDGDRFNLAAHRDQVVVLDFWATWCGPCRAAMPIIAETVRNFEDRGVVLYAINLDEDAETIRAFLSDEGLELPVALDQGNVVTEAYGVEGIPTSMVIGKDGRVQAVHIGFGQQLQAELTSEIETLLDGGDLTSDEATGDAEPAAETEPAADDAPAPDAPAEDTPAEDAPEDAPGDAPVDDASPAPADELEPTVEPADEPATP